MAAKLGDFFVNIFTKADNKGIKEVSTGLDDLLGKAKKLAAGYLTFKAIKEGINVTTEIVRDAAELGRLSDTLGVATEDLEQFGRAFEIVGADAQDAYNIISKLKQAPAAIRNGYGDDMAEAFGRARISLDKLKEEDPIGTFNEIRKVFNNFSDSEKLNFANQLGFSEKTLRVLRQTDEQYQDLLETAKESPLLNQDQKTRAERFTRASTRARISKDALLRTGAIATEPALTAGAEAINQGAKFIDATFSNTQGQNDQEKSKIGTFYDMFKNPKLGNFAGGPVKKVLGGIGDLFEENKKLLHGEISQRDDKKGLREEAINQAIDRSEGSNKTVIINNKFENKTDIKIQEAKDLQADLVRKIPDLVEDQMIYKCKEAAENFKSGVCQ